MANVNEVERLAFTLKNCGIAFSESEAKRMAVTMVSTERKVQDAFNKQRDELDRQMDRKPAQSSGPMYNKFQQIVRPFNQPLSSGRNVVTNYQEEQPQEKSDDSVEISVDYEEKREDVQVDSPELQTAVPVREFVQEETLANEPAVEAAAEPVMETAEQRPVVVELEEVPPMQETQIEKPIERPVEQPVRRINTSQEVKVDLSKMFNYGSR